MVRHTPTESATKLEFRSISHHVLSGRRQSKQILHDISGKCISGRLLAMMGPSGAGKTSLLDILAGVKVREAITTSALLKLPWGLERSQKLQRMEDLLDALDLRKAATTLIGEEAMGVKGISGGEKRRTSVGIELVQDPPIVFLDEPTTGLDSKMALDVMNVLHNLAAAGKMVVCTIHQPNSDITDLFDDWMLLAEGRLLYAGPWSDTLSHFEGLGYPCPLYKSPTDFYMNLASDHDAAMLLSMSVQRLVGGCFPEPLPQAAIADYSHCGTLHGEDLEAWAGGELVSSLEAPVDLATASYKLKPVTWPTSGDCRSSSSSASVQLQPLQLSQGRAPQSAAAAGSQEQQQQQEGWCATGFPWGCSRSCSWWSSKQTLAADTDQAPVGGSSGSGINTAGSAACSTPGGHQTAILMLQFSRSWWRTRFLMLAEAAQYIILGLFLGLLYLQLPLLLLLLLTAWAPCIWGCAC